MSIFNGLLMMNDAGIKITRRVLGAGLALSLLAGASAHAQTPQYDVLIRGGTVFDGTGAPRRTADVAIKDDKIVVVGAIPASATAAKVIDATGKFVAPGFIDPHNHAVPRITDPELAGVPNFLYQGITTGMINPDGGGPHDLAPLLSDIEKVVPGMNVIPTIGHNGVRREVMGLDNRKPTPAELASMEALVKKAFEDGAWGLSTGPFYIPGKYSETSEMVALARVAQQYPNAFHISHIRDESTYDIGVLASVAELIEVSRQTGIIGIVTHHKMLGPTVWGKSVDAAKLINDARAEGLSIWADQYPYAASGSGLQPALLPGWAQEGGTEAIAKRLQNPELRAQIRKEMAENLKRRDGANALMIREYAPDPSLNGMRLDEIAKRNLQDPLDTAIDMLIKGGARTVSFNMNENDVEFIMKQPWTMTSTDGTLVPFGQSAEHPRAYGAFPRKLRRYVMERNVISMEQAIHSGTGLPAKVFAIKDRGELRAGLVADVIVFNPETIRDVATYVQPHAYSEGMEYVFVNGKPAVEGGKVTAQRYGKVLPPNR
jgi:N-acyl-D-amino-acid deacylase